MAGAARALRTTRFHDAKNTWNRWRGTRPDSPDLNEVARQLSAVHSHSVTQHTQNRFKTGVQTVEGAARPWSC